MKKINKRTPLKDIWFYAIGEGGTSIAMNGVNNFVLIFYTKVLGLSVGYAGLALSITTLWDAISDHVMGHISDNTRCCYGRRHPYILIGFIFLFASFLFLWFVPDVFKVNSEILFIYLLVINLILRTAVTVFVVPFTALGFEVCTKYEERAKLQGVRGFFNMVINFIFGATAWSLFFHDGVKADGTKLDGTMIASNYLVIGVVLSLTALILISLSCYLTKSYIVDSRKMKLEGNGVKAFAEDILNILSDSYSQKIFIFLAIAQLGMLLTSQLQIFAYIDFLKFTKFQKSFVHGATMVGFALGSLSIILLAKYYEKKTAAYIGVAVSVLGSLFLYVIFCGNIMHPVKGVNDWWAGFGFYILAFFILEWLWYYNSSWHIYDCRCFRNKKVRYRITERRCIFSNVQFYIKSFKFYRIGSYRHYIRIYRLC